MNHSRLTLLMAGHALAEDVELSAVLRQLGRPSSEQAARAAEAGRLARSLELAGLPADLVDLATRWPAALRPAARRLTAVPPMEVFQAPLVQVLGFMALLATLQLGVAAVLHWKLRPTLMAMALELGAADPPGLALVVAGDLLVLLACVLLLLWAMHDRWVQRGGRSWRAQLLQARQACLLAALHDAGAPVEIRNDFARSCRNPAGLGAGIDELELVAERALAQADGAHRRLVTTIKVGGYGLLTMLALAMLAGVYHPLALLGVSL